jgi:hypothetical protein
MVNVCFVIRLAIVTGGLSMLNQEPVKVFVGTVLKEEVKNVMMETISI